MDSSFAVRNGSEEYSRFLSDKKHSKQHKVDVAPKTLKGPLNTINKKIQLKQERMSRILRALDPLSRSRTAHLLVIGGQQVGKSTITKQFRICHGGSIEEISRLGLIPALMANLADSVAKVLDNMKRLEGMHFKDEQCNELVNELLSFRPKSGDFISDFAFYNCPLSANFLPTESTSHLPSEENNLIDEVRLISMADVYRKRVSQDKGCPVDDEVTKQNSPEATKKVSPQIRRRSSGYPAKFTDEQNHLLERLSKAGMIPREFTEKSPNRIDWRNHEPLLRAMDHLYDNPGLIDLPVELLMSLPPANTKMPSPPKASPPRSFSLESLSLDSDSLAEDDWNSDSPDDDAIPENEEYHKDLNQQSQFTEIDLPTNSKELSQNRETFLNKAIRLQNNESFSSVDGDTGFCDSNQDLPMKCNQPQFWRLEALKQFRRHFKNIIVQPEFVEALDASEFFLPKLTYTDN
ncbi:hypothetical protein Ciccas_002021 [Cichlidogyrus casuarinus]|uniref:Uncharacterized protein n=1 Tax=Cichlidogyrus casuarinus TaxID=1844966 RepID=A0ABD2QIS1_9PLAT